MPVSKRFSISADETSFTPEGVVSDFADDVAVSDEVEHGAGIDNILFDASLCRNFLEGIDAGRRVLLVPNVRLDKS